MDAKKQLIMEQQEAWALVAGKHLFNYRNLNEEEQGDETFTLRATLYWNPVKVTFIKTDNTVREMVCTLIKSMLPDPQATIAEWPQVENEANSDLPTLAQRQANPDVIKVFDIEKNAWRSIRYDSIICYEIIEDK